MRHRGKERKIDILKEEELYRFTLREIKVHFMCIIICLSSLKIVLLVSRVLLCSSFSLVLL